MSERGHIVHTYNRKTVQHKYTRKETKNVKSHKLTKRSINQTNERPTRPNNPTIPKHPAHARIPNNNQNPQKLRRILRTKHHIPTAKYTRKERLLRKRMEHEFRATEKSLQTNKQWTKHAKLHRRLPPYDMQENNNFKPRPNP
jgi:hypothetical protein